MKTVIPVLVALLISYGALADSKDQHSIEAIATALKSPISAQAIKEARDFDDRVLSEGQVQGGAIYLVTDGRATLVNNLVAKLLTAMGQDSQQWVVRVLDTNPPIENAFVTGGKYIYIFTGLIKQASSEDELAFVLSHELGHSLLKHKERQKGDLSTTIAGVAVLAGLISKKNRGNLNDFAKYITSKYSRGDEEEADAIAVAIANRAGFNSLRGADFFSRNKQQKDTTEQETQQLLTKIQLEVQQAQMMCVQLTQQYRSSYRYQSADNARRVNAVCRDSENKRLAYNQALLQYNMASNEGQQDQFFSTHPQDQNRIAAIAALSDFVSRRRELDTVSKYTQSYRVMKALQQIDSVLLQPPAQSELANVRADSVAKTANGSGLAEQLAELKQAHDHGLLTDTEYELKRQEVLNRY